MGLSSLLYGGQFGSLGLGTGGMFGATPGDYILNGGGQFGRGASLPTGSSASASGEWMWRPENLGKVIPDKVFRDNFLWAGPIRRVNNHNANKRKSASYDDPVDAPLLKDLLISEMMGKHTPTISDLTDPRNPMISDMFKPR